MNKDYIIERHRKAVARLTLIAAGLFFFEPAAVLAQGAVLEEIVVTSRAREETLQEVPISVSVVSGEKIERTAIDSMESMAISVPNFTVTQDPIGDKINIRGIFTGEIASLEQSVSTFLDGVNHGRGTQVRFSFLDLERVEVLRGPQGTLFGKNTVGGALNLTTRKPTDDFEGSVKVSYESVLDESEVGGFISGPLSDTLRGRFAFEATDQNEGWLDNEFYGDTVPTSEEWQVRGSLEWDLSDTALLRLRVEHGDFDQVGQPFGLRTSGGLEPILNSFGFSGGDFDKTAGGQFPGSPIDLGTNGGIAGDYDEIALTLDQAMGAGSLETVLAYSAFEFERLCDCDFGPLTLLGFNDTEDYDQTSLSVRYLSDEANDFSYVVGLYYQDVNLYVDGLTSLDTQTANAVTSAGCPLTAAEEAAVFAGLAGLAASMPLDATTAGLVNSLPDAATLNTCITAGATTVFSAPLSRSNFLDQDSESLGIYGQGTWRVTDRLSVTAGIRYTREEKSADQVVYRSTYGTRTPESIIPGDLDLQVLFEATPHVFTPDDLSREENNVTYSASLEYALSDTTNAYLSASTGFKAGGFNIAAFGPTVEEAEFEEEEVLTVELGSKSALLGGAAELNAAIFYTEIDDLQIAQFTGGTTFIVQNAAKAEISGLELDGRYQISDNLGVSGAFSYIDFEFASFPFAGCTEQQLLAFRQAGFDAGTQQVNSGNAVAGATTRLVSAASTLQGCSLAGINDLAGRTTEQVPEFTVQLALDHRASFAGGLVLDSLVEVVWFDEQYRQTDLDPETLADSFSKTNVSFALWRDGSPWTASLIVRNLFDKQTFSYANDTPLTSGARQMIVDKPRQTFLQLQYSF